MWIDLDLRCLFDLVKLFIMLLLEFPAVFEFLVGGRKEVVFRYKFPSTEIEATNSLARDSFPERFYFGASNSACQTRGTWDVKENPRSWNTEYHENCNHSRYSDYETYARSVENIALINETKRRMVEIPLCWSRILPNGFVGPINEDGIEHYNDVIDEMLSNGIEPMITLFHWDTPDPLQRFGGWTNPMMLEWFEAYANIAFVAFGRKVKFWITVNDPVTFCTRTYGYELTVNMSGIADYICGHHVLLAHARTYYLYHKKFYRSQKGKVGIAHSYQWFEPEDETSKLDTVAAETAFQWYNGWLTNPLFGKNGDYPDSMKDRITFKSRIQEFWKSRLPKFTKIETRLIKGSSDFLGINFSVSKKVRGRKISFDDAVSFDDDANMKIVSNTTNDQKKDTSWGLGKLLRRLNTDYVLPQVYVTSSGYADNVDVEDIGRIVYYRQNIKELLRMMQVGIDIRGYLICSPSDASGGKGSKT